MESGNGFTREYNKFGGDVALEIKDLNRFPYLKKRITSFQNSFYSQVIS